MIRALTSCDFQYAWKHARNTVLCLFSITVLLYEDDYRNSPKEYLASVPQHGQTSRTICVVACTASVQSSRAVRLSFGGQVSSG